MSNIHTDNIVSFADLGLNKKIVQNLENSNITQPMLIQQKTIVPIIEGSDVMCESATGSGKTIAFGAPIIQRLLEFKNTRALVLAPTRELAEQIYKEIRMMAKTTAIECAVVYGGVGYQSQISSMERADIIVATPGRMLDHLAQGNISFEDVGIVVLDEADRMLDMGFLPDVKKILAQVRNKKQFLCFSATYAPPIAEITKKMMSNPVMVKGEEMVDPKKLKQFYYDVHGRDKTSLLAHLLKHEQSDSVMVFCNSRSMVDTVVLGLKKTGLNAIAIHGGLTQQRRKKVLSDFHGRSLAVLVCTDVAARGLDISDVTHVYNFDIPAETKQYIHRIGRTARAGKDGVAINLLSARDHENFDRILRYEDVKIEYLDSPQFEKIKLPTRAEQDEYSQSQRGEPRGGSGGRGRPPRRDSSRSSRSGPPSRGGPRRERNDFSRSEDSRDRAPRSNRSDFRSASRADSAHGMRENRSRSPRSGGERRSFSPRR